MNILEHLEAQELYELVMLRSVRSCEGGVFGDGKVALVVQSDDGGVKKIVEAPLNPRFFSGIDVMLGRCLKGRDVRSVYLTRCGDDENVLTLFHGCPGFAEAGSTGLGSDILAMKFLKGDLEAPPGSVLPESVRRASESLIEIMGLRSVAEG